jgi:hypothetical protein
MATTYSLANLADQVRAIGRAAVFYAAAPYAYTAAPTGADLTLIHLGDTEGEISIEANDEFSELTLPELTGPAIHERYHTGASPVVTMPLFTAASALRAILSPSGAAHAGHQRNRKVTERALVLIPEAAFIESNAAASLVYTNTAGTGAWTIGGDAATSAQLALLDMAVWFWRGHFLRTMPVYRHEDGGKVVQEVTFQAMQNASMPNGHQLYTVGRPNEATPAIHVAAAA